MWIESFPCAPAVRIDCGDPRRLTCFIALALGSIATAALALTRSVVATRSGKFAEWTWVRKALVAIFLSAIFVSEAAAADLLVLMHGSGKVERYDAEGKHLGTFISGLPAPNALMEGPDGQLYVSTGVPGANGTVQRFDAKSGLRLGAFINIPAGQPGHLARATGMTWHEGDLLVASQGDGIVKRFDGKTGAWKADVAKASPGGFTQIAVREGRLFLTDFVAHMIRVSDMKGTETMAPAWTHSEGDAAWGLVFDVEGRAFWSTGRQRILRFDGKENVEWAHGLATPVWLSLGPEGLLYAVNHTGPNVTVWDTKAPNPGGPVRVIGGSEMQLPISVAFTTHAFERPVQFGNFTPKPSNTGKDWTPDGTAIYNIRAMKNTAALAEFGLDTEGGDRAKLNLLKEPMRLVFTMKDGSRVDSSHITATSEVAANKLTYAFSPAEGISAEWVLWLDGQNLRMSFAASGPNFAKAELLIPFDPRAMGTTVLAEEWGEAGVVKAPLIISALDMGQLRLSNVDKDERLDCTFTGSRQHKRIDLRIEVLSGTTLTRRLIFAPARLEKPNTKLTDAEWAKIRRGLISLLQITPFMVPFEDGSSWLGSPGGILGNNVISDPVTCNMDRNLQWLAGMGDKAAIMGIDLNRIAKRTIEFWLNHRMNEDGSLDYVLQKGNISADSNTGVLNSATDYFLSTGDTQFVRDNKAVLLKAVNYFIARDLDDDGLIETFRDGNGNNQFGDTGYDTISSGWKNALVNGQAYKSFLGVAKMMESIGEDALAKDFRQRAVRLRKAYNKTFYDAEKGRYIWWIGKDGKRHDYANPLIQANAVLYGIAQCLKQDTGLARGDKDVMQALWIALDAAEYRDTKKGKTVDYMDAKTGNYTGLYWGIPGNLESVPTAYNFQNYGSFEFPYYCNGCIFPQDTVTTITAFAKAGMRDKAALIQRQIFKRQHEGIFPNGSGFYMGVVNGSEPAYSILKWDGTPTDYEGIISRDCSFLQTALLTDDPAAELFQQATKANP